jgi:hypothetical protein
MLPYQTALQGDTHRGCRDLMATQRQSATGSDQLPPATLLRLTMVDPGFMCSTAAFVMENIAMILTCRHEVASTETGSAARDQQAGSWHQILHTAASQDGGDMEC